MSLTRREFVAALAAAPLAAAPSSSRARPFDLKQVRLLEGPFQVAMEQNRAYLRSLEPDRLLHTFRLNAGLPSSARPLGGWERPDCEVRGHFTGHYLSACALMFASTGDAELKDRAGGMVAQLAKCQKTFRDGYLSAFPAEFFDRLKTTGKVWAPFYTIHKIMAGLLDVHTLCGDALALDVLERQARWVRSWTDQLSDEQMSRVHEVEFGGMMEVLFNLSGVTGNPAWVETALRFYHKRVFEPLAAGRDELTGLHVNTQIPKIIGAARGYELTGEERFRRIAQYFWNQVTQHRAYCTGGTSNVEHWRTGPDRLAGELSAQTEECCCTYNLLKLTRHLFAWTADPRCADYYERAIYNGILGTLDPRTGTTMYFLPLASGYWKTFAEPNDSFWCCTGTGVESFAKTADSIYFHDDTGLYVNLFIPSEVTWEEAGIVVRQETSFPDRESSRLTFRTNGPTRLTLRIRVPHWAGPGFAVKVNGAALPGAAKPGSYREIERDWQTGDRVDISLPMSLRAHPMPDDATLQAFLYGPLVLAGELGSAGIADQMKQAVPYEPSLDQYKWAKPVPAPEFRARPGNPAEWIKPVSGRTLAFRTFGQPADVTLVPLNRLFDQRYAVYWRVK